MKVDWTLHAVENVEGIRDYIAQQSPYYGQRMVSRILSRSKQLEMFPQSGEMVPEYQEPSLRELIEGPYRIIYRVKPQSVLIVVVIHGARLLPEKSPG
jgi:plasmid stabilization system protein ParE